MFLHDFFSILGLYLSFILNYITHKDLEKGYSCLYFCFVNYMFNFGYKISYSFNLQN